MGDENDKKSIAIMVRKYSATSINENEVEEVNSNIQIEGVQNIVNNKLSWLFVSKKKGDDGEDKETNISEEKKEDNEANNDSQEEGVLKNKQEEKKRLSWLN